MDELDDFFRNPGAPRVELRGPATSGFRKLSNDNFTSTSYASSRRKLTEEDYSTEYAEKYRREEEQKIIEESIQNLAIDRMEELTSMGDLASHEQLISETDLTAAYNNYSFRKNYGMPKLPIESVKDQVLRSLANSSVIIIEGATGCGKTTQVPQWILDDCYDRRRPCKIAVTQPRRIAAISIAKRVAFERGWEVGSVVGYQVGLENKISEDTHLHYMTTGILLQKLVAAKNMNMYTHIILDEIHERDQEMDFLLIVVKKLLRKNSRGVKVVLMSATFDSGKFQDYFQVSHIPNLKGTDYINVEAKPQFSTSIYYLDQLKQFKNLPAVRIDDPGVTPQANELVMRLLAEFDRIDEDEEVHEKNTKAPSVLVFLPGIHEIEELDNCLQDDVYRRKVLEEREPKNAWFVVPLHSTITSAEQAKAFQEPPPGHRKVILATNIAESSITVPDIKYVIDFCLMKVLVTDPDTNFASLQTQYASRTNCIQRAGRAGRVRDGRVYRLVPKSMYKFEFAETCPPEMERCSLERLVLLAKMLDMGSPKEILALAMDPPKLGNIRTTVLVLKEVGGLLKTLNGEWDPENGDLTYLGRIMARLPLDVRVSKLIVLGHIFGILQPCIIMGAAMTVKNIFNTPFRERLQAYNSKLTWADGSRSDCIAFLNLYKIWSAGKASGRITRANERTVAREMFAQVRSLKEMDDMVRELSVRLSRLGIESVRNTQPVWSKADVPFILKVLMTGAFYPNYFTQTAGGECREREAAKTLNGLDPCNTVYLNGFPDDQPPDLYANVIKRAVKELIADEPRVTFDTNSRKVFLTFAGSEETSEMSDTRFHMPGRVALPVYKAVKARQLSMEITIPSLPPERANHLMDHYRRIQPQNSFSPRLPDISDSFMALHISHTIDPGHFWVHNEADLFELQALERELRKPELLCLTHVEVGVVCLAPYNDNERTVMCRAIVQQLLPQNMVWIHYIDYGNYGSVSSQSLRELLPGPCSVLQPLAIECRLTGIAPALYKGDTMWSLAAQKTFYELTHGKKLLGKIYSVSHGVVSLELRSADGQVSINDKLVADGEARRVEESYDSKLNHDLRETSHDMSQRQLAALSEQQARRTSATLAPDLPRNEFTHTIRLKGPTSPLESSLQTVMRGGVGKSVQIEWNSVNSVLLDTEPSEPYQRLVVAALIGQNTEGSKLTLRHTTMMPNFGGLPAIMALLFAPHAQLCRDRTGSRYAAVLCGLGAYRDKNGELHSIFAEHDLLLHFDVEITQADLVEINHLRFLMNQMLYVPASQDEPVVPKEFAVNVPLEARKELRSLMQRGRKYREFATPPEAWNWCTATVEPADASEEKHGAVYPQHHIPRLDHEQRSDMLKKLQKDKEFHELVMRTAWAPTRQEVVCDMCGVGPLNLVSLRLHLYSRIHRDRVEELERKVAKLA